MKIKAKLKLKDHDKEQVCVLCNETFTGWGNNPHPLAEEGVACDSCNFEKVVPARMKAMGFAMDKDEIVKEEKLEDADIRVAYKLYEDLEEAIGAELLLKEVVKSLNAEQLTEVLEYIAKMHDLEDLVESD